MSLCTNGNDGKGCNYASDFSTFRHGCAYQSHVLKIYALSNNKCPKFSPFMQPNGDSVEQIMHYCDPYAQADIDRLEKVNHD